jgi:hypothetical protein
MSTFFSRFVLTRSLTYLRKHHFALPQQYSMPRPASSGWYRGDAMTRWPYAEQLLHHGLLSGEVLALVEEQVASA